MSPVQNLQAKAMPRRYRHRFYPFPSVVAYCLGSTFRQSRAPTALPSNANIEYLVPMLWSLAVVPPQTLLQRTSLIVAVCVAGLSLRKFPGSNTSIPTIVTVFALLWRHSDPTATFLFCAGEGVWRAFQRSFARGLVTTGGEASLGGVSSRTGGELHVSVAGGLREEALDYKCRASCTFRSQSSCKSEDKLSFPAPTFKHLYLLHSSPSAPTITICCFMHNALIESKQ
ncbi:hypothetical protein Q3G72_029349 [Acer saccharum]|nr:hypothetical protein Q3G72_029349 [Acer saccharum]